MMQQKAFVVLFTLPRTGSKRSGVGEDLPRGMKWCTTKTDRSNHICQIEILPHVHNSPEEKYSRKEQLQRVQIAPKPSKLGLLAPDLDEVQHISRLAAAQALE